MSVDLGELIEALKSEVNPPGSDFYPDGTDEQWFQKLVGGFWDLRLHAMLTTFEENAASRGGPEDFTEGIVTPIGAEEDYDGGSFSPTEDLSRDLQQLIIFWSAYNTTINKFMEMKSKFRAKAGPVEYEEESSATVLKGLLDVLHQKMKYILANYSDNAGSNAAVFDAVIERTYSQAVGDVWWIR